MHHEEPQRFRHSHDFLPDSQARNERQAQLVVALTATMMVIEIVAGSIYHSMALLADGWHMASHASALSITAFTYWFARRHRRDEQYSFGTGKVGVLGGFTSAVVLAVIAILVAWESVGRFFEPLAISFDEAIAVAAVGLGVNLVSAWLLRDGHHHGGEGHAGHAHDHNLRAAYLHVLADALTSVTAIVALVAGKLLGWVWMDPVMGIVGSLVIARWSVGLLRQTSAVLLDGSTPRAVREELRQALERAGDVVADLHVWQVGPGRLAVVASVVSDSPEEPRHYKRRLEAAMDLAHVTVEVNPCERHDQGDGGPATDR